MTCIIGMVDKNKVYIGGDSAGVSGYNVIIRSDAKVFRNGPMLMGFTTSFRMGQILHYDLIVPEHPPEMDDMKYLVSHFIKSVRDAMKESGYLKNTSNRESCGTFLIGYHGKLYQIDEDLQVGAPVDNIAAVGCGAEVALGAMHGLAHLYPKERITKALQITEHLNSGVRPPFLVDEL